MLRMPSITATPNSDMKPIAAETLKARPETIERDQAAADREGNASKRQQTVAHRVEQSIEQRQDQQQRDRDHHRQPLFCFLQIVELARPLDMIAVWQLDCLATRCRASSTVEPRSRPRTLNLIGM